MIGARINPQTLSALLTCAGGEVISRDAILTENGPQALQLRTLKIRLNGARATATIEPQSMDPR